MNRLFAILIVLLTPSCNGQDYSVEGSMTQTVNARNVKHVIIECYCNDGMDVSESQGNTIRIDVRGKLGSLGYHGEQTKPKEIKEEMLSFKTEIQNDTLRLISKEWTYIHHAYLIDDLKIQIPEGIKHEIIKVPVDQLEGREIK